jgi:hypothetical protein
VLPAVLGSGQVPFSCRLWFGFQTKRDFHVVYGLGTRQERSMSWVSGGRGLHAVCGLVLTQSAVSMLSVV